MDEIFGINDTIGVQSAGFYERLPRADDDGVVCSLRAWQSLRSIRCIVSGTGLGARVLASC
jgi:hypothetical protein